MPSAWNPFLYIGTAFGTIDQVKFVPGAKNPDKPEFVDRFLLWRRCSLRVGCISSLIWLVFSLNEFQMAWRNVRDKLNQFPEMVRPYFARFIYAELACQTASEMASVLAVFIFMRAWKEQDNFERSSDLTRLGWFFNTMGPFLPYLLVPMSFFFRSDYFQRDVCASVIGMMAHDPMSSLVFGEAASQASEPELAAALANPLAKPPRFGEPGFDESPAAAWCWRYYTDWQPRLFSEEWMGTALNDIGDGHKIEVPRVFGPTYPGVVPKALTMLAALFGAAHTTTGDFCAKEAEGITKEGLQEAGEDASLMDLGSDWTKHLSISSSNDPVIASLRQKLIKVYQNITHMTSAEAARAKQLLREVHAASMVSFQTLPGNDFFWPLPEGIHGRAEVSSSRKKFFRSRDHIAVDAQGSTIPLPPQELLETAAPDISAGLGKEAICTFKSLMIAAMKMCSFCAVLVTTTVSMYCAVSYSLPLASLIIGVVDGLGAGVTNVKSVLYRSCLPGYLQSITVFVTLPGILFILVFFSQIGGSPLLSLAMCALAGWRAMDFYMGEVAIDVKSSKKLDKETKKVGKRKLMFLIAAAGFFVAHLLWLYLVYTPRISMKLDTSGAKDAIVKKMQDPFSLATALLKIIYVRVFTNMVATNWIMEAVFDAADDTLKVKKESGKHVEDAWAKLTQGKRKKKKKKKKDHDTEEEGYYDEEGWYYPPPGAEGLGEVPDMPPAVGEGEAGVAGEGGEATAVDSGGVEAAAEAAEVPASATPPPAATPAPEAHTTS